MRDAPRHLVLGDAARRRKPYYRKVLAACGRWIDPSPAAGTSRLSSVTCGSCRRSRRFKALAYGLVTLALLVTTGCAITFEDAPPREPAPRTAAAAAFADAWVARVTRTPNDHRRLREHREAKRRARRHARED